jgi:hypothetical protein
VNLGLGKVRQTAGVVEVEVRRDDVSHIARLEAELPDLRDRRLGRVGAGTHHGREGNPELPRVLRVGEAEAGVHEHEPLGALDQQAMTDQACAREQTPLAGEHARAARTHGAAVDVMDHAWRGVHVRQAYLHDVAVRLRPCPMTVRLERTFPHSECSHRGRGICWR